MYVILTNYVNWHRENLRSDRENTGNLKIQFEWVPCLSGFPGPRIRSDSGLVARLGGLGVRGKF